MPEDMPLTFRQIACPSPDYALECALRDEVLRRPLGLRLRDEDLAAEDRQWHFGLFAADGNLVACAVALPLSPVRVKIRQMAVAPAWQAQGIGRRLMEELERNLRARDLAAFELHARRTATGFYQKLGYKAVGAEFFEVGIPHVKMVK